MIISLKVGGGGDCSPLPRTPMSIKGSTHYLGNKITFDMKVLLWKLTNAS